MKKKMSAIITVLVCLLVLSVALLSWLLKYERSAAEPTPVAREESELIIAGMSDLIYSANGDYAVASSGYGGGYQEKGQPAAFTIKAYRGTDVIFEDVVLGKEVTTTGSFPTILGITDDGNEVWGTSYIHGTCPCALGLWTVNTRDGSIIKYSALYGLRLDAFGSIYDIDDGTVFGVQRPDWPPVDAQRSWREVLWYVNLRTGEQQVIDDVQAGTIRSLKRDGNMIFYEVTDFTGWDVTTQESPEPVKKTYLLSS